MAHGELPLGGSFLLMEHLPFIPFGQSIPEVLKHLAEGLAEMHLRDPPPGVQGGGRTLFVERCHSLACLSVVDYSVF